MRLAFVRTKAESTVFEQENSGNGRLDAAALERMKINAKAGSSSKNIIFGLLEYGVLNAFEEWKFWRGAQQEVHAHDFTVKLFPCDEELESEALLQYVRTQGAPEILWVEGPDFPPYLRQIFAACPQSLKIVYSKDWRPWKIKQLGDYDVCLVDEDWEKERVLQLYPELHCSVWDKLIDYEQAHYPIACEKKYDVCYVAYLRGRKNHELLFHAMAKLEERKLKCVCIGDDRKGNRAELEKLAAALRLDVRFTGEVAKDEVNRLVNQSRLGVMCSELDAAPRAILEYLAADVPVLVNAKLLAGARYVGPRAGLIKPPEEFHLGLAELLAHLPDYSPRAHLLEHYSFEKVMTKFLGILQQVKSNRPFRKELPARRQRFANDAEVKTFAQSFPQK